MRSRLSALLLMACTVDATGGALAGALEQEPRNRGWAINAENDSFVSATRDRDYTSGGSVTLAGRRASEWTVSLDPFVRWIDRHIGVEGLYLGENHLRRHDLQFGYLLFTPGNLEASEPQFDDRPYGSLFFLSNTRRTVIPSRGLAYTTRLMFGLIGMGLAETLQSGIHDLSDKREIRGWDNQISAGGEPTAGYSVAMQKALVDVRRQELKAEVEGDIGFFTGGRAALSWRVGRINTPWWSFNPQQSFFITHDSGIAPPSPRGSPRELYLTAGLKGELVLYNVLLQGQFRDSVHTFSRDQVEPLVGQAWLGGVWEVGSGFRLSFTYQFRTEDFDAARATSVKWGSIVLSRSL